MKNFHEKNFTQLLGAWKDEIPRENYSSSIQLRSYKLYTTRVSDYTTDDVRFMTIQELGLKYLVPVALNYLKENLLLETCYYEGDLLHSVLIIPKKFWEKNLILYSEVYQILLGNKDVLAKLDPYYDADKKLIKDYNLFLQVLIK